MEFTSLKPFVPSGKEFEKSIELFQDLGFEKVWQQGPMVGFEKGHCAFILQKYDVKEFAENYMLTVNVSDIEAFEKYIIANNLTTKYNIRISKILDQPYGRELNLIDLAGVCWHFVENRN